MQPKMDSEPAETQNNSRGLLDFELRRPFKDRWYFRMGQVALRLARLPDRMDLDEEEARKILDDLIVWWRCGEFAEDEVVVFVDGRFSSITPWLEEIENNHLWQDAVLLTRPAVKRYLEHSTLPSARRLLAEWFAGALSSTGDALGALAPMSSSAEAPASKQEGLPEKAAHSKSRKTRRDEKRPAIAKAVASLDGLEVWEQSSDKERCELVERQLEKPSGWCTLRTLRRAIADRDGVSTK